MTTKTKKYLLITLTSFLFLWGCEELFRRKIGGFAGSYPFVEYWDLKATESEITDAIIELKKEIPSLQPPYSKALVPTRTYDYDWGTDEMKNYLELSLKDSTLPMPPLTKSNSKSDYWLYIDFYYPDTKEIVHTWTRPDFDPTVTTFALVSIGGKLINRDYWYVANKMEINKFEKTIVDRIQEKIDKKRKSGT